jgi:hypothetical protein
MSSKTLALDDAALLVAFIMVRSIGVVLSLIYGSLLSDGALHTYGSYYSLTNRAPVWRQCSRVPHFSGVCAAAVVVSIRASAGAASALISMQCHLRLLLSPYRVVRQN